MLAIFAFHEPFTHERAIGFSLIWTALAIYAIDGVWRSRKLAALQPPSPAGRRPE
jgi:chloramphenicol-sensitive protein RarD